MFYKTYHYLYSNSNLKIVTLSQEYSSNTTHAELCQLTAAFRFYATLEAQTGQVVINTATSGTANKINQSASLASCITLNKSNFALNLDYVTKVTCKKRHWI